MTTETTETPRALNVSDLTDKLANALYDVVDVVENYSDCDPGSRLGEAVRALNEVLQEYEDSRRVDCLYCDEEMMRKF